MIKSTIAVSVVNPGCEDLKARLGGFDLLSNAIQAIPICPVASFSTIAMAAGGLFRLKAV